MKYLRIGLLLVVGVVIGAAASFLINRTLFNVYAESLLNSYLMFESDYANNLYFSHKSTIDKKINACEHLIEVYDLLNKDIVKQKNRVNYFQHELILTYGRLSFLYEKKGKKELGNKFINKAMTIVEMSGIYQSWEGTNKAVNSISELRGFIMNLDSEEAERRKSDNVSAVE